MPIADMETSSESPETARSRLLPADAVSRGLSAGVLVGGIIGMLSALFVANPLAGTITVASCMAVGAACGAIISLMRQGTSQNS